MIKEIERVFNSLSFEEFIKYANKKLVQIKEDNGYFICNYGIAADFTDPFVQEARGIIFSKDGNIACRPFRKFGNWNEPYVDKIDWSTARVLEKVDGSLMKIWWGVKEQKWHLSTNGTIDAYKAECTGTKSFGELFENVLVNKYGYKNLQHFCESNNFDKIFTYLFEFVSPANKIVIEYPSDIYFLSAINIFTGEETSWQVDNVKYPKKYNITSFEECLQKVGTLCKDENDLKEGFVVVDGNYNRIKVKTSEYFLAHKSRNADVLSDEYALELILANENFWECPDYNKHKIELLNMALKLEKFKEELKDYLAYVDFVNQEFNGNRKAVALEVKKNKRFSSFGFKWLDKPQPAEQLILQFSAKQLLKHLP